MIKLKGRERKWIFVEIITLRLGQYSVNTYILHKEKHRAVIVDPGDGFEALDKALCDKGLVPEGIILTHAHFDHIASLTRLRTKYSCPVYLHKEEAAMLADSEKNMTRYFCNDCIEISDPEFMLDDRELFEVSGIEFSVMHTPGHTKGSCIYRSDNVLFTGDTLFSNTCGRCDLWGGSPEEMKASLDRIFTIKEDLVFCSGHGAVSSLDRVRNIYKYFL